MCVHLRYSPAFQYQIYIYIIIQSNTFAHGKGVFDYITIIVILFTVYLYILISKVRSLSTAAAQRFPKFI